MVLDSVEAILSKADIDGWEDESILRGYLKKIGVKKDTYDKLYPRVKIILIGKMIIISANTMMSL